MKIQRFNDSTIQRIQGFKEYILNSPFSILNSFRLLLFTCLLFQAGNVSGQVQSLKQLEAKRKDALEEIESTARLLSETRSSAQHSLNRLNLLSGQVLARKKVISLLNQEISLLDKNMTEMNDELNGLEQGLTVIREKYAQSLQHMYNRRSIPYKWCFVLSADNLAQSFRRMRYLREYSDWQRQQATLIVQKQSGINLKQVEVEQARTEKRALLEIREKENNQLQSEESEQRKEVQQLNRQQRNLQSRLAQKQRQAEALNRQIESLISKEMTRSAGKTSGSRDAGESTEGSDMSKENRQLSADFVSNQGRLPFPLTGHYTITGFFGRHHHAVGKEVYTNNRGIDIQTTSGAEARAIFSGVVTAVFVGTGYNHGVIIRHGSYLTVYVNLSEVYVKTGDKISTNQRLGKIFTDTDNDHATILHFEVWREKEAMDPEKWIKRK
ncbi:MAG: peptidoglycan DD-metalloendopeptidase family protein [Tannerella sp.]|jgi:septal ring factor EnvC (AmiA/AmiB activator)|nr:peptidoglycan DD-metalloendopeptidase family protein [Tannerella sp.]